MALPVGLDDVFRISSLPGLARDIQFALAPVFLLNGIGLVLNMLTGRLARIVDRARDIEQNFTPRGDPRHEWQVRELRLLDRRMAIVSNSIFLCTASAVLLCSLVAGIFLARLVGVGFARTLSLLFAVSLMLLIASLTLFLIEVRIAVAAIRVRDELLERS
ncbi:DUF2721 domain-containing protein [Sphingomonas sp.]|uniref:DUF2721 domain-containing protein n=1 Tax=Sphingomonas sp. TaxID=28214 RepID=UPI000DB50F63|nr:DUF2721 domain-containing protein [Sphingomonas sp.]PZU10141.1 MAG: DUF2721 domain-containing protein [Sphingomonas sp.]